MQSRGTQTGITLIGMLVIAFLIVGFTLLGLKLAPPYMNNFKVKSDLASLSKQPGSAHMAREQIVDGLERRFEIDEVSDVRLSKDLTVKHISGGRAVVIHYVVVVPLVYNLSAMMTFTDRQDMVGA